MAKNVIKIGIEARNELAKGADFLANAVKSTLGPHGNNFFIEKGNRITNDGVTVAREINLPDEIQNRGIVALREAAIKTNDEVGDGTTTAIVLAQAIYNSCSKYLAKDGVLGKKPPSELIRQIEKERMEITDKLIALSTPIETEEQLINSATVSVENSDLGKLIGSAQWELGKDGILLAEETAEKFSSIEPVHGVLIDNGFTTSFLINNPEKECLEVEEAKIILTSWTIKTGEDWNKIVKVADQIIKSGYSTIVIIARAWTEETIRLCLANINKGVKIYPLNAPYESMSERMKDIQAVVGGTYYDSESYALEDMQLSDVGYAKRVVAKRFTATITGKEDEETQKRVSDRVVVLKQAREGSNSDFEKKTIGRRIAQLENGFAIVKVGSPSEMERKRLFDKCEDAVNAVRAAYQEGTVEGGGLAFKKIADDLPDDYLLKRPLMSVYEQLISLSPKDFVIELWVRDPVKVLRIALEKACLAASSFATATGVIATKNPPELDSLLRKSTIQNE